MAELPRFQPNATNVDVRNLRKFDPIGARAQAGIFDQITQTIDAQTEMLNRKLDEQTAKAATEYGQALAIESETFEKMQSSLPTANTIAGEYAEEAAFAQFEAQTTAKLEADLKMSAAKNTFNPQGFAAESEAIISGTVEGLPPELMGPMKAKATALAGGQLASLSTAAQKRAYQQSQAIFNDRVESLQSNYVNALISEDVTAEEQALSELQGYVSNYAGTFVPPSMLGQYVQEQVADARKGAATVLAAKSPDPVDFLVSQGVADYTAITQSLALAGSFENARQRRQEAFRRQKKENYESEVNQAAALLLDDNPDLVGPQASDAITVEYINNLSKRALQSGMDRQEVFQNRNDLLRLANGEAFEVEGDILINDIQAAINRGDDKRARELYSTQGYKIRGRDADIVFKLENFDTLDTPIYKNAVDPLLSDAFPLADQQLINTLARTSPNEADQLAKQNDINKRKRREIERALIENPDVDPSNIRQAAENLISNYGGATVKPTDKITNPSLRIEVERLTSTPTTFTFKESITRGGKQRFVNNNETLILNEETWPRVVELMKKENAAFPGTHTKQKILEIERAYGGTNGTTE